MTLVGFWSRTYMHLLRYHYKAGGVGAAYVLLKPDLSNIHNDDGKKGATAPLYSRVSDILLQRTISPVKLLRFVTNVGRSWE